MYIILHKYFILQFLVVFGNFSGFLQKALTIIIKETRIDYCLVQLCVIFEKALISVHKIYAILFMKLLSIIILHNVYIKYILNIPK